MGNLATGSLPTLSLSNNWLSNFNLVMKYNLKLLICYIANIFRSIIKVYVIAR